MTMRPTELVIIAGGKGTRMARVSGEVPKALIPVDGRPVLQHQLEAAARSGVRRVTIFAGFLADQIVDFVGDGRRFGLDVRVFVERAPLGTAGGLIGELDQLDEHFLVVYGDILFDIDWMDMARFHLDRQADMTLFVHSNDHPHDSDLVETDADGRVRQIHSYPHPADRDFPNLVSAACYAIRRNALAPWRGVDGPLDFTKSIMRGLIEQRARVFAYRSLDYAKDMGTPERLAHVESDLRGGRVHRAKAAPQPAIFLDRDGTLIEERGYLADPDGVELIDGAAAALRRLRRAGYRLVVVSNQPVIARGEASEADVDAINRRMEWELGKGGAFLDGVYYCPHHPDKGFPGERAELKVACDCRKPNIGMVERACSELFVAREGSWVIGDQTRDIEMARRAGVRSVLVRTGHGGGDRSFGARPDFEAADISAAADIILGTAKA
ncbi:MAG: HAD-IIIA family hydrolase [Hyphomicrobiaceae bacterium]|nr:HAD-IIIA family hydrolase [Hyphomicrobiaceae bacterium]